MVVQIHRDLQSAMQIVRRPIAQGKSKQHEKHQNEFSALFPARTLWPGLTLQPKDRRSSAMTRMAPGIFRSALSPPTRSVSPRPRFKQEG
jgi:hypothetical protein